MGKYDAFMFAYNGSINWAEYVYICFNLQDNSGVPRKSSWDMIVDTTSLVNKKSRKALQLLQGLKGTRLIIPRLGNLS